jgi:hypothetical protein
MIHFCTYFDHRYLPRGLALLASLRRHARPFRLHVLCLDDVALEELRRRDLPEIIPHRLADLEAWEPRLKVARSDRSPVEYFFTCTPCLPLYVLDRHPEAAQVVYLDADLYFFADPTPLLSRLDTASVLLLGHRFPPHLIHLQKYGIYNVGMVGFRNDATGRACLDWWRNRCLEWCFDRLEDARFADQRYLDEWPERFPGVAVATDKGANLAPWNVGGYVLRSIGGRVLVDGEPLIFYHFHGVRPRSRRVFDLGLSEYDVLLGPVLQQHVYGPYLRQLGSFMAADGSGLGSSRARRPHAGPQLLVTDHLVAELAPLSDSGPQAAGLSARLLGTTAGSDPSSICALAALARQRQELLTEKEATIVALTTRLQTMEARSASVAEMEKTIDALKNCLQQREETIQSLYAALRHEDWKEHIDTIAQLASVAEHRLVELHHKQAAIEHLQTTVEHLQALADGGRHALHVLTRTAIRRLRSLLPF